MGLPTPGAPVLELSRGLEDLQYGVGGALNNIPQLALAMGGGAGLAGAISLAAVAGAQLYKHWDEIGELFGQHHTETEAEAMERLAKATALTADEAERLAKARGVEKKVDELRAAPTKAEKETEEAVTKAITENGTKNVAQGILKHAPDVIESDAEVRAARKKVAKAEAMSTSRMDENGNVFHDDPIAIMERNKAIAKAEQELDKASERAAERFAASATLPKLFPGGLEMLTQMVKENPADFGRNGDKDAGEKLGRDLEAASPQARQMKKIKDAFGTAFGKIGEGFKNDVDKQVGTNAKDRDKDIDAESDYHDQQLAEFRRHNAEVRRNHAERVKKAREQLKDEMPAEEIEQTVVNAKLAGQSQDVVRKAVADKLTAKGIKQDVADETAKEAVLDAQRAVMRDINGINFGNKAKPRELSEEEKERLNRKSEVGSASDLTHKAQSAISQGDGMAKKSIDLQKESRDFLAKLVDQKVLKITVN